jgi:glutamine synthetase
MKHAPHLSLFFAPFVNSYKRYQSVSFAPVSVAWDTDNRTCGFRVIGGSHSLRVENRIPGADVNPYLAFAATLAAGLDGIENKLEPPAPIRGNAYRAEGVERVPCTYNAALDSLAQGKFARQAFGDEVVEHYLRLARMEQQAFDAKVTDWEIQRYFERV